MESTDNKNPHPERVDTDSSLRVERQKTDSQLAKRDSSVDQDADEIVRLARARADDVLEAAREQADRLLQQADGLAKPGSGLPLTRAFEDQAVNAARAAADGKLEGERSAQKQALTLLLALEREDRLEPTPGAILFTVRDSGCGIAADQLDAIFERFSQVTRFDRRGLGLGLYIARCIVEAHGGKIWVESAPGQGSTFHFTLPWSS